MDDLEAPVWQFVAEVVDAQPRALRMIKHNGFVFETNLAKLDVERTPEERWEKLAFSLYTNLCELTSKAEHLLAEAANG